MFVSFGTKSVYITVVFATFAFPVLGLFGRFYQCTIRGLFNRKVLSLVSLTLLSVHSVPGHLVDASDFLYGTCMHMHLPYVSIKYLAYMPNLVGIFVSGRYLAIACEVDVVLRCILASMLKLLGPYAHITY